MFDKSTFKAGTLRLIGLQGALALPGRLEMLLADAVLGERQISQGSVPGNGFHKCILLL